MTRLLVREGTEPAGDDIYIRDLFITVMENLANIELLIMQMVSTEDARKLRDVVENGRDFNNESAGNLTSWTSWPQLRNP
jgi:methyl-accepting chemotaxis protein